MKKCKFILEETTLDFYPDMYTKQYILETSEILNGNFSLAFSVVQEKIIDYLNTWFLKINTKTSNFCKTNGFLIYYENNNIFKNIYKFEGLYPVFRRTIVDSDNSKYIFWCFNYEKKIKNSFGI